MHKRLLISLTLCLTSLSLHSMENPNKNEPEERENKRQHLVTAVDDSSDSESSLEKSGHAAFTTEAPIKKPGPRSIQKPSSIDGSWYDTFSQDSLEGEEELVRRFDQLHTKNPLRESNAADLISGAEWDELDEECHRLLLCSSETCHFCQVEKER